MARNVRIACRQDEPPNADQVIPLWKIKGKTLHTFIILSANWEGFNTHWFGGRTVPHRSAEKLCKPCLAKCRFKWSGFIHVCPLEPNRGVLIEITAGGAKELRRLQGERPSLRGMQITTKRENGNDRGTLLFERIGWATPDIKLPIPHSAVPTLKRLWNVSELD